MKLLFSRLLLLFSRIIGVYRVDGHSMYPTLKDGDFVFTTSLLPLRVGSLVVVKHARFDVIVKRVREINADGITVIGDAPASTSSEAMGVIRRDEVLGRVIYRVTAGD